MRGTSTSPVLTHSDLLIQNWGVQTGSVFDINIMSSLCHVIVFCVMELFVLFLRSVSLVSVGRDY